MKIDIMFQGEGPSLEFVEVHLHGTHQGVNVGEWSIDDEGYRILTLDVMTEAEKAHYSNPEAVAALNQALTEIPRRPQIVVIEYPDDGTWTINIDTFNSEADVVVPAAIARAILRLQSQAPERTTETPLVPCNCEACAKDAPNRHKSDCAVHNEPAYPNGPCNCRGEG